MPTTSRLFQMRLCLAVGILAIGPVVAAEQGLLPTRCEGERPVPATMVYIVRFDMGSRVH